MFFVNDPNEDNGDDHPGRHPYYPDESSMNPWLLLAVSVLPAILPVLIDRVGAEVSGFFRRKRVAKQRAELAALKEARKQQRLLEQQRQEELEEEEQQESNETGH